MAHFATFLKLTKTYFCFFFFYPSRPAGWWTRMTKMKNITRLLAGSIVLLTLLVPPVLADHGVEESPEVCIMNGSGETQVCFKAYAARSSSDMVSYRCSAYDAATSGTLECRDSLDRLDNCDWNALQTGCSAPPTWSDEEESPALYTVTAEACVGPYAETDGFYIIVNGIPVGTGGITVQNAMVCSTTTAAV